MSAGPFLANALWLAGSLPAARRFDRALSNPQAAQESWLHAQLRRHANSEFGREHSFASLTPREFTRTVPLSDYSAIEERIGTIANGARDVLACGPVTHLAPTSGSTRARKLIPFNASLQEAFNAAVGPWMMDLARQRPGIVGGPAYWSISPTSEPDRSDTAVPIGFADDADYLGGPRAWLVRQALAVPASIRHVTDTNEFWKQTLVALLRRRDLRLISVWHPSFLDLLVQAAVPVWPDLMSTLGPGRAAELRRIGPYDWPHWWPSLQVVSCWGEQAAEPGWRTFRERLPNVLVQPKGLLATECVVTIPLGADRPLAVTSHFFEFLDRDGNARLAHELERGAQYEVVVTNGGGLWRYRLGDMVECTGFVRATPSLQFLGRAGRVSDLRGEKLSETFVAQVLNSVFGESRSWAALRPRATDDIAGYDLLVNSDRADLAQLVDEALVANPHYALARRLGQLAPVRLIRVRSDAEARLIEQFSGRLGDAKPVVLLL
jgi:GH3 auxin-responsive promoter